MNLGSVQITLAYSGPEVSNLAPREPVVAWHRTAYQPAEGPLGENALVGLWKHRDRETPTVNPSFDVGFSAGPALVPLSDAAMKMPLEGRQPCTPPTTPPNIVLYIIDTLRVDRVGAYGNKRGLTPFLDKLAESSLVLERAVAQSPWTRPSVVSLMTGLTPLSHGVTGRKSVLPPEFLTLAEILSERGYSTAGFVTNPNVSGKFGLRQGFSRYVTAKGGRGSALAVNKSADAWLSQRDPNSPFFLYLHTVEPHAPYQPSKEFADRFAAEVRNPGRYRRQFMKKLKRRPGQDTVGTKRDLELLYDAEVAENDAGLGALIELLDDPDLNNTVLVVVSDHGEEFLEHGRWEHGKSLHTEVLDIPFILHLPGCPPARLTQMTQHADLLPTLLDYLHLQPRQDLDGKSVLCARCDPSGVVSHVSIDSFHGLSITTTRLRYIDPEPGSMGGSSQLFDMVLDPLETRNVLASHPVAALYFASRLADLSLRGAAAPEIDDSDLDQETIRRLRTLGYIE